MRSEPIRVALIVLSLVLVFTAFRLLKSQPPPKSYWDVFYVWVAGISCFVAAFVHRPRVDLLAWWRTYRWELMGVIGLTAIAAALRLVELGKVPNIVSGDEGRIGLLALSALKGEINNMMATTFGHSTLYLFIIAALMKLSDIGPQGLRLTSAIAGALTRPGALCAHAAHVQRPHGVRGRRAPDRLASPSCTSAASWWRAASRTPCLPRSRSISC